MSAPRALLLTLCCLTACGGQAPFASRFPSSGDAWSNVLARSAGAQPVEQRNVVVGVADGPRSVFAYDLAEQRLLFRANASVVALPLIASDFAIVPEGAHVTIRRLADGAVVREIPSHGMHLVGAAGDGSLTAIVLSSGGTLNARSRFVLMQGDEVSADERVDRALGAPAVLGGIAFVPHNRVHVSAIAADGRELARVRVQHDVASYAFAQGPAVYFGQRSVTLLDGADGSGGKQPTVLRFELKHKLPGNPPVLPDTSAPPAAPESALHRVSLSFAPQREGEKIGLRDDALYLAFYRLLFGLAPDAATARWVYETESDLVGVRAVEGGVIAVESRGAIAELDASGRLVAEKNLGLVPLAASIRAGRMAEAASGAEPESAPLQLERALRSGDTRIVPARAFAATLLGAAAGEDASRALVRACADRELPERVREASCEALVRRTEPSDALVAALATHGDYLEKRANPPIGPLALAAAAAREQRAVPHLIAHLESPATTPEDLEAVVGALKTMADPTSAGPLTAFVRLYHADVPDEPFEGVLALGMQAIAELDGERARAPLEAIAADQLARPGVRGAAERALAKLAPREQSGGGDAAAEAQPSAPTATDAAAAQAADEPAGPPVHLTTHHVDEALAPVRVQLARCVRDAPEHPASARLVLVIEGDGTVTDVKALPESVLACAAPLVRATTFPATKYARRSVMSYVVAR